MLAFKCANGSPLPSTRISPGDTVAISNADEAGLVALLEGVRVEGEGVRGERDEARVRGT